MVLKPAKALHRAPRSPQKGMDGKKTNVKKLFGRNFGVTFKSQKRFFLGKLFSEKIFFRKKFKSFSS